MKQSNNSSLYQIAENHLSSADPILARIISVCGRCELKPQRPYFFVLCDAIISQQLSVKAAATIVRRFRELYPKTRCPAASDVLSTPNEKLCSVGISRAKTLYIKDLAEKSHSGAIKYRRFSKLNDEEIIDELVSVKGIGRWTAEMFLIFSLNRLDVLPVKDLGLQRAVQVNYGFDAFPSAAQLIDIGERWRPYRTIATWYMWRSLK